ncbi:MAG: hypothetical protein OCC49_14140 [Fibrobacterales bacterium]
MPNANVLKRGNIVTIKGQLLKVVNIDVQSPSSRGAVTLYKVRYTNLKTGLKVEEGYKGGDFIEDVDLIRRKVQYSFTDADMVTFMDVENYEQYFIGSLEIADQLKWVHEDLDGMYSLIVDENMVGLELPEFITLSVEETAPVEKGAFASSRNKPAKLSNGIDIQVPESVGQGDSIKVDPETSKFVAKA